MSESSGADDHSRGKPNTAKEQFEARFAEIEARLADEVRERRRALTAQEHRLLPAIRNAVGAIRDRSQDSDVREAVTALVWCLIPSRAGLAVGVVGLLTLALTAFQLAALEQQNQKIDIQNALMEGQRRSAPMAEFDGILLRIEEEKRQALSASGGRPTSCATERTSLCFRELVASSGSTRQSAATRQLDTIPALHPFTADDVQRPPGERFSMVERTFVPSPGSIARLAALTHAARPYRQLLVGDEEDCVLGGREGIGHPAWVGMRQALQRLAREAPERVGDAEFRPPEAPSSLKALGDEVWSGLPGTGGRGLTSWLSGLSRRISGAVHNAAGSDSPIAAISQKLSCKAVSPERGRILAAMVAAEVDLASLAAANVTFEGADLGGFVLDGRLIEGVNLARANLRGASLRRAILLNVSLLEADLTGADVNGAVLQRADVKRAVLPVAMLRANDIGVPALFKANWIHEVIYVEATDQLSVEGLCTGLSFYTQPTHGNLSNSPVRNDWSSRFGDRSLALISSVVFQPGPPVDSRPAFAALVLMPRLHGARPNRMLMVEDDGWEIFAVYDHYPGCS